MAKLNLKSLGSRLSRLFLMRLYYVVFWSVVALVFGYLSFFLYQQVYQTLYADNSFLYYQESRTIDDINIGKFNQVLQKIDVKSNRRDIDYIKNIF